MYAPIFCAHCTLAGSRVGFNRNPAIFRGFARMNRTGPLLVRQACQARTSLARLRFSPPLCGRAAGENSSRPGGLRAGSPPSPPPRSIWPTVQRLPRPLCLSGRGHTRPRRSRRVCLRRSVPDVPICDFTQFLALERFDIVDAVDHPPTELHEPWAFSSPSPSLKCPGAYLPPCGQFDLIKAGFSHFFSFRSTAVVAEGRMRR